MMTGINGGISSKRFFGGVGLTILHLIAIYATIAIPESHWIGEYLITLSITDSGLLGVGVLEKKHSNKQKTEETPQEYYEEVSEDEMNG